MTADARLDDAIDGAVREMLDVEPPDGLRHRVIERLPAFAKAPAGKPASGSQLPAAGFRLPASGWLVGAAAAAMVVLAVFLTRGTPPQPETTTVQAPLAAAPVTAAPALEPRVVPTAPETSAPARRRNVVAVSRAEQAIAGAGYAPAPGAADTIEPLQSLAPIQVAPVGQRPMTHADIAIAPLNPIADLEIAPLNPPERRN